MTGTKRPAPPQGSRPASYRLDTGVNSSRLYRPEGGYDRNPADPELVAAKQNLRAVQLKKHVARVLAEAPPLTDEQRERIAALLRAGGAA